MTEYQLRCRSMVKYAFYHHIRENINVFVYQASSYAKQSDFALLSRSYLELRHVLRFA